MNCIGLAVAVVVIGGSVWHDNVTIDDGDDSKENLGSEDGSFADVAVNAGEEAAEEQFE